MKFSCTPLLFLAICTFWAWAARQAERRGEIAANEVRAVFAWLALLGGWGVATSYFAVTGIYRSAAFYDALPGLWVPLAPVTLSLALIFTWPALRRALWVIAQKSPPRGFLLVHSLRIAAIGGLYKVRLGLLPASFVYPIGIPDFLFGTASLYLAFAWGKAGYERRILIGWNLLGMAVLAAAPLLMQLGLPGPLYVLRSQPDARTLFEFPMVLAPTLVVTVLFFMNGWQAFALWRAGVQTSAQSQSTAGTKA
ncbi:MAG: hypothetical protein KGJ32_12860 [Xanthomonadaceae bacterium]|nr:hypothetical protein [Xanthomonadaceae bacterium]